jgi:hypothetical protein
VIVTDSRDALELRRHVDVPVVCSAKFDKTDGLLIGEHKYAHPDFPSDVPLLEGMFRQLGTLDLNEPFDRVRDAIAEARKMGVTQRAAG